VKLEENTAGFTTDPLTASTWYRVYVYAIENGCEDLFSTVVPVIVTPDISISAQPVGGSMCVGGILNLSVTASAHQTYCISGRIVLH
jgi:hypothetical protein